MRVSNLLIMGALSALFLRDVLTMMTIVNGWTVTALLSIPALTACRPKLPKTFGAMVMK